MDWNMNTEPNEYGKHTSTSSTDDRIDPSSIDVPMVWRHSLGDFNLFRFDRIWVENVCVFFEREYFQFPANESRNNCSSFDLWVPKIWFSKAVDGISMTFFWIRYEKRCIRAGFRYGTKSYCSKFHASNSSVEILHFSAPQVAEWYLLQYPCMNALAVAVKSIRGFNSTFGMESTVSIQHYWHHSPCELAWKTR